MSIDATLSGGATQARWHHSISSTASSFQIARARSHEVQRLLALSDDGLSRRGLRRSDVVRHVFETVR